MLFSMMLAHGVAQHGLLLFTLVSIPNKYNKCDSIFIDKLQ